MERTGHIQAHHLGTALLIVGALALAVDPAAWLLRSWTDPGYGSHGWAIFALALGVFAWSLSSPISDPVPVPRSPFMLLMCTAAIRGVGQVLDIDTISALALGVDVYALARLARLDRRVRAVSPVGLAALFLCSLPLQRLIQRSFGQGLQELSADGACAFLSFVSDDIACNGVQITLDGAAIMVDLPCAGIGGLTLLAVTLIFAATILRPGPGRIALAAMTALAAALLANTLRVALLSYGAAHAPFDILAEPFHSITGLVTLGLSALAPLAILSGGTARRRTAPGAARPIGLPLAAGFAASALLVLSLPSHPLDAAPAPDPVTLPTQINGLSAAPQPLSAQERQYYHTYGGGAAKAGYGPMGLLVSRTASPLRHLHDAQDCLRGLGFDVTFIGTATTPAPASIFALTAPDGSAWIAHITYTADDGTTVPTVSAAVWHWFAHPGTTWTAVQRFTPAALPEPARHSLDLAVLAALDIPLSQ